MFIQPDATEYINQYLWQRDELLLRLEAEAEKERIPIVTLDSIQLISQLVRMKKAASILEIGTAIGYSAIWLARSYEHAQVLTLEIDEEKVERARENIWQAGLGERVTVLHRDASLGLPEEFLESRFDFMFIDAAKAEYITYLEKYLPHLNEDGVMVCDNTFFHGLAFGKAREERQAWIGEKVHQFNQSLFDHPELLTTFLPIGDGLAISIKK